MRKIREVLKLYWKGGVRSGRSIGRAVGCGRTAVQDLLLRAEAADLKSWDAIEKLDEDALEKLLYSNEPGVRGHDTRPLPNWRRFASSSHVATTTSRSCSCGVSTRASIPAVTNTPSLQSIIDAGKSGSRSSCDRIIAQEKRRL